jgi:hypothetical protein
MKTRIDPELRSAEPSRQIYLAPDAMLPASKDRFSPGMVSVKTFRGPQHLLQILSQALMIAGARRVAFRVPHQILSQDGLFPVRPVLGRLWLKIETNGTSGRRFHLRQLT